MFTERIKAIRYATSISDKRFMICNDIEDICGFKINYKKSWDNYFKPLSWDGAICESIAIKRVIYLYKNFSIEIYINVKATDEIFGTITTDCNSILLLNYSLCSYGECCIRESLSLNYRRNYHRISRDIRKIFNKICKEVKTGLFYKALTPYVNYIHEVAVKKVGL